MYSWLGGLLEKMINCLKMKQFAAFVTKEFRHILRDRRTLLILLGMPVAQILLFGFALTNELKNTRLAILDPAPTLVSSRIAERFEASPYFTVAARPTSPQQIDEAFKSGLIGLAVVFQDADIQLIADGTNPNQAMMLTSYATGIIEAEKNAEIIRNSQNISAIYQNGPVVRMLYNPQGRSAYNFVPGVMGLILMLICAMMTAIAIVREKETGTMEVLLVSPMRPIYIILAKTVPYFVLSIANLATILLLSVFVLQVPVSGNILILSAVSGIFVLTALSLGLLISTLVSTQMAAMLASGMGLMMPTMLLSGLIYPIESMPMLLQWLSTAVPARWYIEAVRKVMIMGVDVRFVVREMTILGIMTIGLVALALRNFKERL